MKRDARTKKINLGTHRGRVRKDAQTTRQSPSFDWALPQANVQPWRIAVKDWCATRHDKTLSVQCGNVLLDYAIAQPDSARTPERYCEASWVPPVGFMMWLKQVRRSERLVSGVHQFFEWFLQERVYQKDEWGRPIPSSRHRNPLPSPLRVPRPHQTARALIPAKWVRMMLKILVEKDWAWARSAVNDDVDCIDQQTGESVRVWSPVRAGALALMLLMPLRNFQVRMLDSGEGDSTVFEDGKWVPNTGPCAPLHGRRRQGFLREYKDSTDGRVLTGFYVNTNKTSFKSGRGVDTGYEIPWEHPTVIALANRVADWQKRYNPVVRPLPWSQVPQSALTLGSRKRTGSVFFLFRDPKNANRQTPMSYTVLRQLWCRLLLELERRLARAKQRMPDGSPISLVKAAPKGQLIPSFNLHCLRVSLLTSMARDGGVPLHILSKAVAGHSSVLMTLYYVKTDERDVSDELTKAARLATTKEQERFQRHLASEARDERCFVTNDAAATEVLAHGDPRVWKMMTTGLCPVGGARCGEGGPAIGKHAHASVPGKFNCVHCRFHVSGPAFLPGLYARFNAASFTYSVAEEERQEAHDALTALEEGWDTDDPNAAPVHPHDVDRAETRLESAVARSEAALRDMAATKRLIERCEKAARLPTEKLQLVLAGRVNDVKAVLETGPAIALWDAVCQTADLHPVEAAHANEKRARALDRMLVRHGVPPAFAALDGEVLRKAANQMVRVLTAKLGRHQALNLIDGRIPEVGAGVARLVAQTAAQAVPQVRALTRVAGLP